MLDSNETWTAVRRFMHQRSGVVLDDRQSYLLESRLGPVARQLNFRSIDELVRAACAPGAQPPAVALVIDAMTTHETSFFRDRPFWKALEESVLPELMERAGGPRPLRIWSAACSTGQEPYSLAMLLEEKFPSLAAQTRIFATDLSVPVLERAARGVFGVIEVNRGLQTPRLLKHFDQHVDGFCAKASLRERISWSPHNLLGSIPGPSACDLVLCRNVLIYFDDESRAKASRALSQSATATGFVGIGATEMIRQTTSLGGGWFRSRQFSKSLTP